MDSNTLSQSINLDDNEEDSLPVPDTQSELPIHNDEGSARLKSDVWNFFSRHYIVDKNGKKKLISRCKGCDKEFTSGGGKNGTTTLRRHMDRCKSLRFHDVGQMFLDHEGKVRTKKVNPKIARELLAAAVIKHDLSFSFVEYEGIRAWQNYISPTLPSISRNTLVSDINKVYLKEKEKLKHVLKNINHRICLTSDVWTACTSEGYITLTAHFVDENWKLKSKILNFDHMPPPHSGVELAAKVFEFLKGWEIEGKIFSLTLDNASSNDTMQTYLKNQLTLHHSLLCGGEFFHIRCSAHILNLIVQEGLKVGSKALSKIRESVKYVKGTESRMRTFEECVKTIGGDIGTNVGLRLDVCTRWNSTYLMLDSALKYKIIFSSLPMHDKNYKWCPSDEEWTIGERICEFLEPFYEITNLISGSSYPTSNLYFMEICKIEALLRENLLSEDVMISAMSKTMMEKFDKYWSQYSVVLAFGAILDPRIKLQMLGYFYSKVDNDPTRCQSKVALVKKKLYMLFSEYASKSNASQQSNATITSSMNQTGGAMKKGKKRLYDDMKDYESQVQHTTSMGKSQLDLYLEEPKLDFMHCENLDILEYWKNQSTRFPDLASMACDVLAIPITSVASESAFSIGARVLTKYRSSMVPENFQALICTRNWLHGFVSDDHESASNRMTSSGEGSNVVAITDDQDEN